MTDEEGVDCGGSSCEACATCDDGIQNGDETGVDCGGSSCAPCSTGPEIIHQGFFETGLDGWVEGGNDCSRVSSNNSYEGSFSVRIRDNSGVSSSMTLSNVDVSSYGAVEVEFYFYPKGLKNGEDFWLRYFNGSSWQTVATYVAGSNFSNNSFYVATVSLDAGTYNLASNAGFRFQCDASSNKDQVYIDQVTITGIPNATTAQNSIAFVGYGYNANNDFDFNENEEDLVIYPNPVRGGILNVKYSGNTESTAFKVLNLLGQVVIEGQLGNQPIDVSRLQTGVYLLQIIEDSDMITEKFIVK